VRRKGGHFLGTARSAVKHMPEQSPGREAAVTSIVLGLETSGQEEEQRRDRMGRGHGCWELLSPAAHCPGPC